ncbi:MAG: hypothetical protein QW090_04760 [Candidatus Bathyarchaeia archaeon]
MKSLKEIICELGERLGFEVEREVPASSSAWVDIVWYDKRFRFPKPKSTETLLRVPKLPVVAFEIEVKTAINPKHIKGSIANLDDVGASMGILVLGKENLDTLRKGAQIHQKKENEDLWKTLLEKVRLWTNEAHPKTRIVIITEDEIREWAKREGIE